MIERIHDGGLAQSPVILDRVDEVAHVHRALHQLMLQVPVRDGCGGRRLVKVNGEGCG